MKLRIEFLLLVVGFVSTVAGAAMMLGAAGALIVTGVLMIAITLATAAIERL